MTTNTQPTPSYQLAAFVCPACGAFAQQQWFYVGKGRSLGGRYATDERLRIAICAVCGLDSIWRDEVMIFPDAAVVPPPNDDLLDEIKDDYLEAAGILNRSPRGAAALLRLCVQKLCKQLGLPGDNINADIKTLVEAGLSVTIQRSLDIVRVVGNNAVHPGVIDLRDNKETAERLFALVNLIAETQLTHPRAVEELFEQLPQASRDAIAKRDK